MEFPYGQDPGAPFRSGGSGVPEHGRIAKHYSAKVGIAELLGESGEGEVLPAEREPAQRFEVSRETRRQALRESGSPRRSVTYCGSPRAGARRFRWPRKITSDCRGQGYGLLT
ncbi:hypothetical protein ADK74_36335 [Streptomyces decoyicus]|nr:hypothetical protein ADK74_36335 [Streptomyces decoyicus]